MSQRVRGPAKIRAAITREVWPPFRTAERRPRSEEDPYMIKRLVFLIFFVMVPAFSFASVFGTVRVIVHDPQHRPVQGATVTLKSSASAWSQTQSSNQDEIAEFATVPVGDYQVSVSAQSFAPATVAVAAISGRLQEAHARGGHQVTWALDGVALPNTNIASNVGPQIDPKDADYVEQQRGTYSAEYGDRTYGVFNVIPRSGFARSKQAELLISYGSYNST